MSQMFPAPGTPNLPIRWTKIDQDPLVQIYRFDVRDYVDIMTPQWPGPGLLGGGSPSSIGGDPAGGDLYRTPGFPATWSAGRRRNKISGYTRNSAGTLLPGCAVHLFSASLDVNGVYQADQEIDQTTSDATTSYYEVYTPMGTGHYLVAYLAGSPDVTGATRNDVVGA